MAREQHSGSDGTELGRFLRAHRARVTPEEAGLAAGAGLRRTPGLRREELATLAGISIDYYTRMERGKETHPSPSVVDALAAALQLDTHAHEHLRDLAACAARGALEPPAPPSLAVQSGVTLLLEGLRPYPAYLLNRTTDVLACNQSGLRLFAGLDQWPAEQHNVMRYVFLHPEARKLFDDWEEQIRALVGRTRALAGTEPDAPDVTRLIDELLLKSPEFARLWDRYDVQVHTHGNKTFHHPDVGDLTIGYQSMVLEGTPGHRLVAYYAEPGTPEYDKMVLLDMAAQEPSSTSKPPAPQRS